MPAKIRDRQDLLESGQISFSVESRILRELGERLVKKPEVALLELIKNSYDADAKTCVIDIASTNTLVISDDGHGMTLSKFKNSWMRVGTSSKADSAESPVFGRVITGEKGIGRFAVRFLGKKLKLTTIADDQRRGERTKLTVDFDWPEVDRIEDLGEAEIPFRLESAGDNEQVGTTLSITGARIDLDDIDWQQVRTGAIGVVSPLTPLLEATGKVGKKRTPDPANDPGFELRILDGYDDDSDGDLAAQILENFVLRGTARLTKGALKVQIFERGDERAGVA